MPFFGVRREDGHKAFEGCARERIIVLGEDDNEIANHAKKNSARRRRIEKLPMKRQPGGIEVMTNIPLTKNNTGVECIDK